MPTQRLNCCAITDNGRSFVIVGRNMTGDPELVGVLYAEEKIVFFPHRPAFDTCERHFTGKNPTFTKRGGIRWEVVADSPDHQTYLNCFFSLSFEPTVKNWRSKGYGEIYWQLGAGHGESYSHVFFTEEEWTMMMEWMKQNTSLPPT